MSELPPERPAPRCPVCGKPQELKFRPFCSSRCARIDLGRWLKQGYAIPGRADDEGEGGTLPDGGQAPDREG